jgi:hypothetical protein
MTASDVHVETWKPIPGFGSYEAGDRGHIRSVDRVLADGRRRKGVVLKTRVSNRGYVLVNLRDDGGVVRTCTVHTLQLLAFAGPCPPGQETRHLNDVPTDNFWPENICYGTPAENAADKIRNAPPPRPRWSQRVTATLRSWLRGRDRT